MKDKTMKDETMKDKTMRMRDKTMRDKEGLANKKKPWPMAVIIYTDGACRGNPGPCSLGLKVLDLKKNPVYEESSFLEPHNTNNFAEYRAVVRALELSCQHGVRDLCIYSDSLLLVRQLENKYKVKSANIKPLFLQCKQWMRKIRKVRFQHIPREQNIDADALANKALDAKHF